MYEKGADGDLTKFNGGTGFSKGACYAGFVHAFLHNNLLFVHAVNIVTTTQ